MVYADPGAVLKKCCHCRIEQPLSGFYKNNKTKGGLHRARKSCKNEYYKKNKDKLFPKVECDCGKTMYKVYKSLLLVHEAILSSLTSNL